ncbi:MAG: hypothetical protein MJZ24_00965 [Paludibacteraceae bacterium]|nr:hypothetical protein [Paludibacteraceae bacterium]
MGIKSVGDTDARRRLISPKGKLRLNDQLELLGLSKGSYYYRPVETCQETTDEIMRFIDKEHSAYLDKGVVGMKDSINEHFRK